MKRVFFYIGVIMVMIHFLSVSSLAASSQQSEVDKITLRMNWIPYVDYAFYVIGVKKGFYKEQGIELSIGSAKGSELSAKLVANGQDSFGTASADTVLMAYLQGVPLKVLAIFHQTTPVSIFSLGAAQVQLPKDLEGKKIASDPGSMKHKQFEAFCKQNNVDRGKITVVPIKGSDFIHLLNGSVDAALAFGYMGEALLKEKGLEFNEIKLSDHGIGIYGISLITNEKMIRENPGLVKRFVTATTKSWDYAINHPEEAVDALIEVYPELDKETQLSQIAGIIALIRDDYTLQHGLGHQSKKKWEQTQDLLFAEKMIETKTDPVKIFTNEFLPAK